MMAVTNVISCGSSQPALAAKTGAAPIRTISKPKTMARVRVVLKVRSYENVSWKIVEWRRYDSLRGFAQRGGAFKRRRSIGKEPGRFYYSHALSSGG
jgi:hypothetical protein